MHFVLQTYTDTDFAWGQYELVHCKNTHRISRDLFNIKWKAAHEIWVATSGRDVHDHRVSRTDYDQVVHTRWGAREMSQRQRSERFGTRQKAVRTYRRRFQARMDEHDLLLNVEGFGSNRSQDAFRAIMLRDGRSVARDKAGGWVRKGSRKYARLFYDTPAAAPRPSSHLDFTLPEGSRQYEWIILDEDGYTSTDVDPGDRVTRTHTTQHTERTHFSTRIHIESTPPPQP